MVHKRSGFTLIELVVAVALMAVMFTALSVVFNQATQLIRRSEGEVALYQNYRLVYKTLKKDFESIVNYEDPLFYRRCDETRSENPKLDYGGYLRIENGTGNGSRIIDNMSFLASDPEGIEIQNYLANDGVKDYVKTNIKGTDLVEISYGVEDGRGKLITGGSGGVKYAQWTLMRYVRKVVDKAFVSNQDEGRSLYGLVYKAGLTDALTGHGAYGMDVFNGTSTDRTVWIDFTKNPPQRFLGRDPRPNKYGERAVMAEGCCGFDVKYWYYRSDSPHADWSGAGWAPPSGTKVDPYDPYVTIGHFYNGMPPNPANTQGSVNQHPNWWYLPRMMQIRITMTDRYQLLEQDFWMRVYIPSSDPRPKVN